LGDRRLRDEKRSGDLVRGQTPEYVERERDPRVDGQHRVAGREDEAEQVVFDVVIEGRVDVGRGPRFVNRQLVAEQRQLALEPLLAAQVVDRAAFRDGHEPGARVAWDARPGPLLKRGDQRVLRQLLGQADVPHHPGEAGDESRRLDPPDRVDRAMRIGSRHGNLLKHLRPRAETDARHR
jgi:hypothetical protein